MKASSQDDSPCTPRPPHASCPHSANVGESFRLSTRKWLKAGRVGAEPDHEKSRKKPSTPTRDATPRVVSRGPPEQATGIYVAFIHLHAQYQMHRSD
jgi:hypothetical protein